MRSLLIALLLVAPLTAQTLDISREYPLTDATLQPAFGAQTAPAVATDGTNNFAVWLDLRTGAPVIRGALISAAGDVLDPSGIVLSTTPNATAPAILWTGSDYAVSWRTAKGGRVMMRVRRNGQVIAFEQILATDTVSAALATNGRSLLAAWTTGSTLHLRLFTVFGQPAGDEVQLPRTGTVPAAR